MGSTSKTVSSTFAKMLVHLYHFNTPSAIGGFWIWISSHPPVLFYFILFYFLFFSFIFSFIPFHFNTMWMSNPIFPFTHFVALKNHFIPSIFSLHYNLFAFHWKFAAAFVFKNQRFPSIKESSNDQWILFIKWIYGGFCFCNQIKNQFWCCRLRHQWLDSFAIKTIWVVFIDCLHIISKKIINR